MIEERFKNTCKLEILTCVTEKYENGENTVDGSGNFGSIDGDGAAK